MTGNSEFGKTYQENLKAAARELVHTLEAPASLAQVLWLIEDKQGHRLSRKGFGDEFFWVQMTSTRRSRFSKL
jgi:hypothetical protein